MRQPALGVIWDGTGYGTDGNVWGGEFLDGDAAGVRRVAHFRSFRLPGGETAIREPRRSAAAVLWELEGAAGLARDLEPLRGFSDSERSILARMLERGLNTPVTTSVGRLFDAMAALLGLHQQTTFEGQAAMAVELVADRFERGAYPIELTTGEGDVTVVDWRGMFREILEDLRRGTDRGTISARFHNALVAGVVAFAQRGDRDVLALSGGCFQNALLVNRATEELTKAGFRVLLHRQVPPNDGGIALGQLCVAAAKIVRG